MLKPDGRRSSKSDHMDSDHSPVRDYWAEQAQGERGDISDSFTCDAIEADKKEPFALDLREFFEYYDSGDPYHAAAVTELMEAMPDELLNSSAYWFQTWSQAGRRIQK